MPASFSIVAAYTQLLRQLPPTPVHFRSTLFSVDVPQAAQTFHAVHAADDFSQPTPYSYKHETTGEDGAVTVHEESGDGQGRVSGSYSFSLPDGRQRTVRYTADETGFHPELTTNEQGTESNSPADSSFSSSALPGPDAAHAAEPERLRQLGAGGFKSKA